MTLWLLILASVFSSLNVSANNKDEYQQTIKDLSSQIKSLTNNLNANKGLLKTERDKLVDVEKKIARQQKKLRGTEKKIEQQKKKQASNKQQIETLMQQQKQKIAELVALVRARYQRGSPNLLKVILNQQNPHAVGRLENYYRYFSKSQNQKLQDLRQQLAVIVELRKKQELINRQLEEQHAKAKQQQEGLLSIKNQRSKKIVKLNQKVIQTNTKLKNLKQDRQRLNSLMKALVAKLEEKAKAEKKRKQTEDLTQKQTTNRPVRETAQTDFLKYKGKLKPPVNAELKYGYGQRLADTGIRAQGNFYSTSLSQEIKSIHDGFVIFADYLKGYGLLIIIDHGDDHISLYGHNQVLFKGVGDAATAGERIAASGVSGGLQSPGLYFEIRRNAAPINPNKWLIR